MPSPSRRIQLLFAVAISAAGCKRGVPIPEGDVVATLTAPSADDKAFDPASLRGKPTLVIFASPSCGYCAQELPIAQRVAAAQNANIVAVYINGGKPNARAIAKKLGYTGTTLVDDGSLRTKYDIKGVPFTLILNADGTAHEAFHGLQDESTLRDALADAR